MRWKWHYEGIGNACKKAISPTLVNYLAHLEGHFLPTQKYLSTRKFEGESSLQGMLS